MAASRERFTEFMSFGAPNWLWALTIVPLLAMLYAHAERRSAVRLREFVSPRLLTQLVGNVDRVRRAIRFALVLLALALAITAFAKPRWGTAPLSVSPTAKNLAEMRRKKPKMPRMRA